MKLVRRLLFHVFATVALLDLTVHNVQFWNLLTDYRINLFRQFVNKMQRIAHGQGAANINYSTVIFNFNVCRLS